MFLRGRDILSSVVKYSGFSRSLGIDQSTQGYSTLYFVAFYLDFLKPCNQAKSYPMILYLLFVVPLSDRVVQLPSPEFT